MTHPVVHLDVADSAASLSRTPCLSLHLADAVGVRAGAGSAAHALMAVAGASNQVQLGYQRTAAAGAPWDAAGFQAGAAVSGR